MQLGVGLGLTRLGGRGPSFSPADIADLAGWWDASDTATITESGGAVSQIDDKSGNSLHLVQANATYQPATGTTTINGKNVLAFGSQDTMYAAASSTLGQRTLIGVWEHVSGSFMLWGMTTSGPWAWYGVSGSTSTAITDLGTGSVNTVRNNGAAVTGVSTRGQIYNTFDAQVNLMSFAVQFETITTTHAPLSYPFSAAVNGQRNMAEMMIYDRFLSAGETAQVEAYLAAKWGVTLA